MRRASRRRRAVHRKVEFAGHARLFQAVQNAAGLLMYGTPRHSRQSEAPGRNEDGIGMGEKVTDRRDSATGRISVTIRLMSTAATAPIHTTDDINARILAVSEDRIQGFQSDRSARIARQSGVELPLVIERHPSDAPRGTIRRVRQTLMSINLAAGGLIAWVIPEDRLNAGFEFMFHDDPFSGHIVIRSTDKETSGSKYRLWTTLKVPAAIR